MWVRSYVIRITFLNKRREKRLRDSTTPMKLCHCVRFPAPFQQREAPLFCAAIMASEKLGTVKKATRKQYKHCSRKNSCKLHESITRAGATASFGTVSHNWLLLYKARVFFPCATISSEAEQQCSIHVKLRHLNLGWQHSSSCRVREFH